MEPPSEHSAVTRVRAILGRSTNRAPGVDGAATTDRVRVLDDSARTAAAAAAQLGCPVGAIANSLVFLADGEPVLILTSGAHRVDTSRVAALLGVGRLARASADDVRAATGMTIGGVAPVGHSRPLRTVVDVALRQYDEIWAAAGHPHTVFSTTFDELVRLTNGAPAQVAH